MHSELDELAVRIIACERDNQRLRKTLKRQNLAWIMVVMLAVFGTATATVAVRNEVFNSIQAREITILDQHGVVRARMSGDMPDAKMYGGRIVKRGAQTAGFMIYDKDGIERGGYVTFDNDNAMLSLDSKHHMVAGLIAAPDEVGTGVLKLSSTEHSMELRSDEDGARMSVNKGRIVQLQMPAIDVLSKETCREWKELEKKYPSENLCRSRYTEAACRRCMSE